MRNCINIKCYVPSAPRPRDDYIWLSHWLQAGNNARPYMPLAPDTTLEPGEVYHLVRGRPCRSPWKPLGSFKNSPPRRMQKNED
ncbi:hypothetical protein ACFX12_037214 [Malus domestica]